MSTEGGCHPQAVRSGRVHPPSSGEEAPPVWGNPSGGGGPPRQVRSGEAGGLLQAAGGSGRGRFSPSVRVSGPQLPVCTVGRTMGPW